MITEIISSIFIVSGLFFMFVGAVGLIRLPDLFTRMHATTKCDTLGAGLVLIGLMVYAGFTFLTLNLLMILGFIWLTNPTGAHYIAESAYVVNMKTDPRDKR